MGLRGDICKSDEGKRGVCMRLWHKDLIPVLPRQQLLGQWRECCLIAKNIAEKGTPGHILVNKIMEYPIGHFVKYCELVFDECKRRGYRVRWKNLIRHSPTYTKEGLWKPKNEYIFKLWHNKHYLRQCYFNLEEKYDCGGLTDAEWYKFTTFINDLIKEGEEE